MDAFVTSTSCPSFMDTLAIWIVMTFQALSQVCNPYFRLMCESLSSKAPKIGKDALRYKLVNDAIKGRELVKAIIAGTIYYPVQI